ncbi:hypothetical protein [Herbiconiux ginsengi]|nr:hypothetical protein [Herbiconiux ginsengi]
MSSARSGRPWFSTPVLMTCAAFAAAGVVAYVPLSAPGGAIAALAPPLYAIVAGVQSVMVFTARRFTGITGTATITGLIGALIAAVFSPVGPILVLLWTLTGAIFDLTLLLWERRSPEPARPLGLHDEARFLVAAAAAAAALFAVSLPVFSPHHLSPAWLGLTLAGRLIGELGAVVVAGLVVRALVRVGIRRPVHTRR